MSSASASLTAALQPGQRIDRYVIERLLGCGGMGAVYLAQHESLGTKVAVKVLSSHTELHAARFLREARILGSLRSEHVAKVLDFGVLEELGVPFMVMEFLPGTDLDQLLHSSPAPLSVNEVAAHVLEACEALVEAHLAGVVHRDLKPSNLFLTSRVDGSPMIKVLDFGIAKVKESSDERSLTATDTVFGSPAYMSPEQVRGVKFVSEKTDVWSLAIVTYELCSQEHPFLGDSPSSVIASIAADAPRPLESPLWPILEAALHKDPERRSSLLAFARGLLPFAGERGRIAYRRIERMHGEGSAAPQTVAIPAPLQGTDPRQVSGTDPTLAAEELAAASRTTFGTHGARLRPWWWWALAVSVVLAGAGLGFWWSASSAPASSTAAEPAPPAPVESPPASVEPRTVEPMASAPPAAPSQTEIAPADLPRNTPSEAPQSKHKSKDPAARPTASAPATPTTAAPRDHEFK